jgi:hypothetical protein
MLAMWIFALLLQEVREVMQTPFHIYFASFWNYLDQFVLFLFVLTAALRAVAWLDHSELMDPLDVVYAANQVRCLSNSCDLDRNIGCSSTDMLFTIITPTPQLLALAALLSCVRFLNVLETHSLLGPLQVRRLAPMIRVIFSNSPESSLLKLAQNPRNLLLASTRFSKS